MAEDDDQTRLVEPLARTVRGALRAANMTQADAVRVTGVSSQHLSQIVNRRKRYSRPPSVATMQRLAKIPGLSVEDVARAVTQSAGIPVSVELQSASSLRRAVQHNLVDEIPEDQLARVFQVLRAMRG